MHLFLFSFSQTVGFTRKGLCLTQPTGPGLAEDPSVGFSTASVLSERKAELGVRVRRTGSHKERLS